MKKYIRPFLALLCTAATFAACSDDDNINIGDTTVQFKEASMTISEGATALNIPIEVTGIHQGTVTVHVQYIESNGLKDDENIIITDRDLQIPAGVSEVNLETRLSVATEEDESGRVLTFQITDVQGANLGNNATCNVNLREFAPYEGSYGIFGLDPFTGYITGGLPCSIYLSETASDVLEIDFGYGSTVRATLEPAEIKGDYYITILGGNNAGSVMLANPDTGAGEVYETTFCYAIRSGQGLGYNPQNITAYLSGATQTISVLTNQAYMGVGLLVPNYGNSAAWLEAYLSYPSETGEIVPVQFMKL